MRGAAPPGISSEEQAAAWVRGMFGGIARHYDLLNHLLSFNLDRRWRARTVQRVADVLARPEARILDLCCGTGDLTLALEKKHGGPILGCDFCHPMLVEARGKAEAQHCGSALFEADALALPVADGALDLVTIAFGFRNLANYDKGLAELLRVLKPGGVAAILEFSQPTNPVFAAAYGFFSDTLLPLAGGLISGSREAYSYLPASIRRFPAAEELAQQMTRAGFARAEFQRMTFGAVALHLGWR